MQAPMRTWVEGTATAEGYELPQQIMRHRLHDFVLVSEDEIRRARGDVDRKGATPLPKERGQRRWPARSVVGTWFAGARYRSR